MIHDQGSRTCALGGRSFTVAALIISHRISRVANPEWRVPSGELLLRREEAGEDGDGLLPLFGMRGEALAAGARQPVELRPAVVVGEAPRRRDVAFLLQLDQRGVECAVIDGQPVAAGLLNAP